MAVISLIVHFKNKLIDKRGVLYLIIPGVLSVVGGAYLAKLIKGDLLKRIFGGFLILLAIFQLIIFIKGIKDKSKENAEKNQ